MAKNMTLVEKVQGIIRTPEKFFKSVEKEKSIKPAFVFDAVITAVSVAISYVIGLAVGGVFSANTASGVSGVVFNWIFGMIFGFVCVGFFHIFIRLLGGKGKYLDTYKALIYASAISLLTLVSMVFFGFGLAGMAIGVLSAVAVSIWCLYVTLKGVSILHKISMFRAFGAFCIAVFVAGVIAVVLFLIFLWPTIAAAVAAAA